MDEDGKKIGNGFKLYNSYHLGYHISIGKKKRFFIEPQIHSQHWMFDKNAPDGFKELDDKWMLVIVKQMLLEGKETFKGFTESKEAIATNILSAKLKLLEEVGIITKNKLPDNKKTNLYLLTEKGLALTPIIAELAT